MLAHVTSALIAGGKSTRFGSPKEFAEFGGKKLIDHAIETALSISKNAIMVGNGLQINHTNIPVYADLVDNCGPIAGIYTALCYAKDKYVAVLPVDMPLLNLKVYRALYPSLNEDKPVVACSHKGIEPLVSIWPVKVVEELRQQIEKEDFRLYHLLKKLAAIEINFAALPDYKQHWFENINYKKDINLLKNQTKLAPLNIK